MKTFAELRTQLDEVNFKQDMKKNHLSATKIKTTEVHYHSEKKGSNKVRVFVKPKSAREFEELGVFKDMNTAKKSAEQFVKLMGEDIDEGVSLWKEFREKAEDSIVKEGKYDTGNMSLTDLKPKNYRVLKKELEKIERKVGFSTMEDGVAGLFINNIKDMRKTVKVIEDILKKLNIKDAKDVDFRRNGRFKFPFQQREEVDINEEEIVYKVQGIQKPEMDRFNSAGRMMGLKVSFQKKGSDTMVTMKGTKKKLRDFDSVARGKSSYGDASAVKHFDEDNLDEFGTPNMSAAQKANLRRSIKNRQNKR